MISLVVSIRDMAVGPALTLKSAKKAICQRKAVHEQQQRLKDDRVKTDVDAVHSQRRSMQCPQKQQS